MTLTERELREFMELNIELGETLALATEKVLDFADKHDLAFPERVTLGHLLKRATSMVNAMRDSPPGKLPVHVSGGSGVVLFGSLLAVLPSSSINRIDSTRASCPRRPRVRIRR